MPSSSPLRHDLSPSLPNPTKRGRTHPRLPEPTLTAMSTAATLPRRDSPATDCLPLTPHGLVCKTPVTTHACLLGSACTASRRSGLPHISTHTSDHNIDATRSTSTGRRDYVPSSRSIPAPAGRHRSAAGKRAHRGRGRRQATAAPRSEPHRATSIRPEPLPGQRHSLPTPSRG